MPKQEMPIHTQPHVASDVLTIEHPRLGRGVATCSGFSPQQSAEVVDLVMSALHQTKDPHFKSLSLVDLGLVYRIDAVYGQGVSVELIVTTPKCSKKAQIKTESTRNLNAAKEVGLEMQMFPADALVNVSVAIFENPDPPWTLDSILPDAREAYEKLLAAMVFDGNADSDLLDLVETGRNHIKLPVLRGAQQTNVH